MQSHFILCILLSGVFANIIFSSSDMVVDGPIMALTNMNNKRLVDVVSLTSDRKCITIQISEGPTRLPGGLPASTDVVLNKENYPTICPKDHINTLGTSLVIIQVKALDFSRNGYVDLLVSLAPDTYEIDRDNKQVINILYFQVGEEYIKYSFNTLKTLFPNKAADFYPPITLPNTTEPLVPLLVNDELFAPDLLYVEGNKTLKVLVNVLASYSTATDGMIPFYKCVKEATTPANCFRDEFFYRETELDANISVPLDISQVDLSGNCKPEIALKMDVKCVSISQDSIFYNQINNLSTISNRVLSQYIPYNPDESCAIVRVFRLNFSSRSRVSRYELDVEHSIFLGVGVGMLTFVDINNNAAMDLVFSVCRSNGSSGCLLENSVHILYNKQMYVCNSEASTPGVCRGKSEMCMDDPNYAFNTREIDILIYPLPRIDSESSNITLSINIKISRFDIPRISAVDYRVQRKLSLVVPVTRNNDNTLVFMDLEPCSGNVSKLIAAWEHKRHKELSELQDEMLKQTDSCPPYLQISSIADSRVYPFYIDTHLMDIDTAKGAFLGNFIDFVGNAHTNLIVSIPSTSLFFRFSLPRQITGFFLKAGGLNDLCFDSCRSANPKWKNSYYTTLMPGTAFKYVTSDISPIPSAGAASQFATIVANPLMPPYTFWATSVVAEYIDVLFVGNIYSDNLNYMSWSSIVPNSYAAISQYPPMSSGYWVLNSFLPDVRGTETFVVIFALSVFLVLLIVTIILHCCEVKRDKHLESRYSHSLYRNAL